MVIAIRMALRFFGKYLAIDVCPLLPECHDSEVNFGMLCKPKCLYSLCM